jgi:hypothetical protein
LQPIRRRQLLKLAGTGLASTALAPLARGPSAQAASRYSADALTSEVAWRWFEVLYDVVRAERTTPPEASRIYGLAAIALYEAIVGGAPAHVTMVGQLKDLHVLPGAPDDAYWPAVANGALAATIAGLMPRMSAASRDGTSAIERALREHFSSAAPSGVIATSEATGRKLGMAILDWAKGDGFETNRNITHRSRGGLDAWQPTPPAFIPNPLRPGWGSNRPLVLGSGREAAPSGPPGFAVAPGTAFHESALEVYRTGRSLTADQRVIADFWADGAGTGTPPGHWMAIVSQISRNDRLSLAASAEAFLRAGIAVHDAFICCWSVKYEHDLLRPVSYINAFIDAAWQSYVVTPPFPSYTSGHSTQSGAVATVLTDQFGLKRFRDTTNVDHALTPVMAPRLFTSFDEAGREAAVSRLYGGIHYAFDNDDGYLAGQRLGQAIVSRVQFRGPPKA